MARKQVHSKEVGTAPREQSTEENVNRVQRETSYLTGKENKPNEDIRAKRNIITSMEPIVVVMAKLRATEKEQGLGHLERIDEG